MFHSRARPVVYPQYEHMRLAGELASAWSNEEFELPTLPPDSFRAGVALHDLGFGTLDDFSIGRMSSEDRAHTLQNLMSVELADRVAETVIKHHALRLMDDVDHASMKAECRRRIARLVRLTGIDPAHYLRADRITDFCDSVAFSFCFELPVDGEVSVYPRNLSDDMIRLHFRIEPMSDIGRIVVDPWPFMTDRIDGYLIAFERDGYPDRLGALQVRYSVRPTTERAACLLAALDGQ